MRSALAIKWSKMFKICSRCSRIPILLLFIPALLQSQTGTIQGSVRDHSTMEPIGVANVQVLSTTLGAVTDVDGKFTISSIPVGTYQLRASLIGFQPVILSDIVVASGKPALVVVDLFPVAIDLEGVDVSASYFQKSPDVAVSAQRLSFEEIRRSPGGFEDVVRAIAVLPGVAQARPGRNDLVVRGGSPAENLFVVDNIEIPNINHFGTQGASGGPLSFINLDFVRETEFATGGFGVRYGDKLSSILNIDLRDGRTDRVGGKGTISASQFGLNLEVPTNIDGSLMLSARRSYLDLIFKAAGFSFVPEYWDFLARYTLRLDKTNKLSVLSVGAIDDVSFSNKDAEDRFDNSRILGTAQKQYVSGITWQHLFGGGFMDLTLGRTWVNYNGIQRDSLLRPIFTNKSKEGETAIKGDVVMSLGGSSEFSFGMQVKRTKLEYDLALPSYITSFGDTLRILVNNFKEVGYKGGFYGQWSSVLLDRVRATVGARLDYFDLIERRFHGSPRFSVSYDLSEVTSVSATAGVYRQSPSYVWLVANSSNRGLSPIRVDQYVLSAEHLLQADVKVRVEGFVKRYSNYPASISRPYLVLANSGGGFGGSDENFASFGFDKLISGGSGRSVGVELLLQKKLSDVPLYGLVSLTVSDARFTALDGVERPGSFDQRVIANMSTGYRFDENWEASMKFRFATGAPYTPFKANGTQNVAAYNSEKVKNAHSLDLRVDRRWNFSVWDLITYLDIQNVYNNKFSGGVRWNAREQRVETNESGIGILPSIGISAEF
jgi:hypothetical protein